MSARRTKPAVVTWIKDTTSSETHDETQEQETIEGEGEMEEEGPQPTPSRPAGRSSTKARKAALSTPATPKSPECTARPPPTAASLAKGNSTPSSTLVQDTRLPSSSDAGGHCATPTPAPGPNPDSSARTILRERNISPGPIYCDFDLWRDEWNMQWRWIKTNLSPPTNRYPNTDSKAARDCLGVLCDDLEDTECEHSAKIDNIASALTEINAFAGHAVRIRSLMLTETLIRRLELLDAAIYDIPRHGDREHTETDDGSEGDENHA